MRVLSGRFLSVALLGQLLIPAVASAQIEEPRIPLQTKQSELYRFRNEYVDLFNKKDGAAIAAMYAPDAVVVAADGSRISGMEQIKNYFAQPSIYAHLVVESDTLAIFGNTAIDTGTTKMHPAGGGEQVARYMVVLRRGMNEWKVVRVQLTPVQ